VENDRYEIIKIGSKKYYSCLEKISNGRRENMILYFKTTLTNRINAHYKGTICLMYSCIIYITLALKIIIRRYVGRLRDYVVFTIV